jgi:hypothetical protein
MMPGAWHSIIRHVSRCGVTCNFVYRINDRQHFIRIGKTPVWSIETARDKAKYFRSIVDQGRDPASGRDKVQHVESVIQYIAEHLQK